METWAMIVHGAILVIQLLLMFSVLQIRMKTRIEAANQKLIFLRLNEMKRTLDGIAEDQKNFMAAMQTKIQNFAKTLAFVQKEMISLHPGMGEEPKKEEIK